jgi:uncharacterized membrane protein
MDGISKAFEVVGVAVLAVGFLLSIAQSAMVFSRTGSGAKSFKTLRSYFGRSILLSLEILVAADLIRTVAVQPSVENIAVLGLIIVIRTILSFSLEVEIDGVLPWRRKQVSEPAPEQTVGP